MIPFHTGTIPGPVLTGSVIDSACALWQDVCGSRGSCWVYDRFDMSWRLFAWWIGVKIFSSLMFFVSSQVYRAPNSDTESAIDDEDCRVEQNINKDVKLSESVLHDISHV